MDKTLFDERSGLHVLGGTLVVTEGQASAKQLEIGAAPVTIGRAQGCSLTLDDRRVSALHCELRATSDGVRVEDKHSRNGTFVNDVRILTAAIVPRGGVVRCGATELTLGLQNRHETLDVQKQKSFQKLVGASLVTRSLFTLLHKVAKNDRTVLISGETGTGKEAVARAIHEAGKGRHHPFQVVDCTTIPPNLVESYLFGHEKGAFTDAHERQPSPFLLAGHGTVFIDEIGDLPIELQAKLLRAIDDRKIQSVGGRTYVPYHARIIAATRRDLADAINRKTFRDDLYFRLRQVRIDLTPLRERPDDIVELIDQVGREEGVERARSRIPKGDLVRLMNHAWPGNVRELRHAVASAIAMAEEGRPLDVFAQLDSIGGPPVLRTSDGSPVPYKRAQRAFLTAYFADLKERTHGHLTEMAEVAKISRPAVAKQLTKLGLRDEEPRVRRRLPKL
jgi:DNA-binding NtrC family response regulator